MDDVAFLTDEGGWILLQAKKGLKVAKATDSPLAEALAQLVEVIFAGVPSGSSDDAPRDLEPSRDRVLILTDEAASEAVDPHLRKTIDRLRDLPACVPITEASRSGREGAAFAVVRSHLERLWGAKAGYGLGEPDLREFGRLLAVRKMSLLEGGPDYAAAVGLLTRVTSSDEVARRVWQLLQVEALRLAEERSFLDRTSLVRRLATDGIVLEPLIRLRPDIDRLRARTQANVGFLGSALTIEAPDGDVKIRRVAEVTLCAAEGNVAVIGDAGAGKTSLLHGLATQRQNQNKDIVVLLSSDLRSSSGQTRMELDLEHEIADVLLGWPGEDDAVLLIDGLDQTRGFDASAWLDRLMDSLAGSRWRLVATIRTYDIRHAPQWRQLFKGPPVSADYSAADLNGLRHLLVGDLATSELADVADASPMLAGLLESADGRVRRLLANPFNLSLAALLLRDPGVDLTVTKSRIDLLDAYWQRRVDDEDGLERRRTLHVVVNEMMKLGRQSVSPAALPALATTLAIQGLQRSGVLRGLPLRAGQGFAPIEFSHPVLFDYAASLFGLGDTTQPMTLLEVLSQNPNFVLTVRPSLDYRFASIWRDGADRDVFWKLALRLADARTGHPLAVAAASRSAVLEIEDVADLDPLIDACLRPPDSSVNDAHTLLYLVAAAAGRVSADLGVHGALGQVTAKLSERACETDDVGLAGLALSLAGRLLADLPETLPVYFDSWLAVAHDIAAVVLADTRDPRREALARRMGNLLGAVAAVDAMVVSEPVLAAIQSEVFEAWGAMHVWALIDRLPSIAATSPDVALALADAVWAYQDDRDIVTSMHDSSILGMTSNRRQDLEGLRYHVGTQFEELARADPQTGTTLLLSIPELSDRKGWPALDQFDDPPWPQWAGGLAYSAGHDVLESMVASWISVLMDFAETVGEQRDPDSNRLGRVVDEIVNRLTHGEVWQRLLVAAVDAEDPALAKALYPAVTSPSLFIFDGTWVPATRLVRRRWRALEDADRALVREKIAGMVEVVKLASKPSERRLAALIERRRVILEALDLERPLSEVLDEGSPNLDIAQFEDIGATHWPTGRWEPETPEAGTVDEARHRIAEAQKLLESQDRVDHERGAEELLALWSAVGATGDRQVRVELACRLSSLPITGPASPGGQSVYECLQAEIPDAEAPPAEDEPLESWDRHAVWSGTPTMNALLGLLNLLRRGDWRAASGTELRSLLKPFVDSSNAVYRFLTAPALPYLFTGSAGYAEALQAWLSVEEDLQVVGRLIPLLGDLEAAEADEAVACVLRERGWGGDMAVDGEDGAMPDPLLRLVAQLAIANDSPNSSQLLREWFSRPVDHHARVKTLVGWMRPLMNPIGLDSAAAQRTVFELITLAVVALAAEWHRISAALRDGSHEEYHVAEVVLVADAVASQLYFASGAFAAKQKDGERAVVTERFCDLALPLMSILGEIHHPKVTHHLIETLDHLSSLRPRESLLTAAAVLSRDGGYSRESLGLDATLTLARRFLGEHRELLREDWESLSAVRSLLEAFVRAGWSEAIKLTEELDELFN